MRIMTVVGLGLGLGLVGLVACSGEDFESSTSGASAAGRGTVIGPDGEDVSARGGATIGDGGAPSGGQSSGDAGATMGGMTVVGGSGGTGPEPECDLGDIRCVGRDRSVCTDQLTWGTPSTCPSACLDGTCVQCAPDQRTCDGLQPQVCDANGKFSDAGEKCEFACRGDGVCAGECVPGSKDCGGEGGEPRICTEAAEWSTLSACQFVCIDGTCGGSCTPGDRTCDGLQPEACSDGGEFEADGDACPFLCTGEGECTGECVPTSKDCGGATAATPRVCSGSASWLALTECPFVCIGGECTGVCKPGSKQCDGDTTQTCDAAGQWVTDEVCSGSKPRCYDGPDADPACVCEPGDIICKNDGQTAQECQDDGTRTDRTCSGGCEVGTNICFQKVTLCTGYNASLTSSGSKLSASCGGGRSAGPINFTGSNSSGCFNRASFDCPEDATVTMTCEAGVDRRVSLSPGAFDTCGSSNNSVSCNRVMGKSGRFVSCTIQND